MFLSKLYLMAALAAGLWHFPLANLISERGAPETADGIEAGKGKDRPSESTKSTLASSTAASASTLSPTPPSALSPFSKIIAIVVGSPTLNKSLAFTPSEISASPGDILQFQFSLLNHTVTQSSFSQPCQPIQDSDASAAGINSGFVATGKNDSMVKTFNVPVNDTGALYIYCAQGAHCMLGMVMSVNAGANQSFAMYKAAAAQAARNVPASAVRGGVMGSIPAAKAVPPPA